jgi:uncharacterized protein YdeI (YjbR/CyaY-like superfamily)
VKTLFFKDPQGFREWLEKNHATETEIGVGYYKKSSGKTSMTYKQAVQQALCFGWIDGVGRSIDDERYMNRFTPRKKRSTWSLFNINTVKELQKAGLMTEAGMKAFEARDEKNSGIYSFEQKNLALDPVIEKRFKKEKAAWEFFEAQRPSYKRTVYWWLKSAKKEETKESRFQLLLKDSRAGKTVRQFTPIKERDS